MVLYVSNGGRGGLGLADFDWKGGEIDVGFWCVHEYVWRRKALVRPRWSAVRVFFILV